MAEGVSGFFAIAGAALGFGLKAVDSGYQAERRANSKVLGLIKKTELELNYLTEALQQEYEANRENNDALVRTWRRKYGGPSEIAEDQLINKALVEHVEVVRNAGGSKAGWTDWPALPEFAARGETDFKTRQDGIWNRLMPSLEGAVSEKIMELSPKFSMQYSAFYKDLMKRYAKDWHPYFRYKDAQMVINAHMKALEKTANGRFWLDTSKTLALFVGRFVFAIAVLVLWSRSRSWLDAAANYMTSE